MNETETIRSGEELNVENLLKFLRENLDVKSDAIEISQFPAGSSNLTYSVKVGAAEYVLRRPAVRQIRSSRRTICRVNSMF